MAGKVLTEEDFQKGGDPTKEDTSKDTFTADQKFDQDGKAIVEEPEKKEAPVEEEKVEPQPKPSEPEKKYKYASMDEYDKAYKEAEKKMHEATTERSKLQKELEKYTQPPEKPKTLDDQIRDMTRKTMKEINMLPGDSATRDEDAGFLWSKLQGDIADLKYEERLKHADSERQVVTKTYNAAQKEGIKTDAELRILGFEFSKTDSSLSTDERINQAIESTKGILSQIREGFVRDQERDRKEKEDLKVLGRGSTRREVKEPRETKPATMSSQLAELNEKRRMTKDDLR